MEIRKVTREEFIKNITDLKEDRFAKTFRSKADSMDLWDACLGIYDDKKLCCAIIISISKSNPKIANLQLLHTFYTHRGKGYARKLTETAFKQIHENIDYLRVSSEKSAIGFYKKLGFKFLGKQKSGCQLSMFKVTSDNISECSFNIEDPIIHRAVYRKDKGGCIYVFK